jgi:dipeptide/tripeptide permease
VNDVRIEDVGTALTVQMALGFLLTGTTIWLVPALEQEVGWRWAFAVLAVGPVAGIVAMRRLLAARAA